MNAPPAAGSYGVIYSDPPWMWKPYSDKGKGRSAEAHYDCMSLDAIKALPVSEWAGPDCALLLWATSPLLPQAFEVMTIWGCAYESVGFVWAKRRLRDTGWHMGCGYGTRANAEHCLLGTRGKPKRLARDVRQLVVAPRREHSRKPDKVAAAIERLFPGARLEMFARTTRPGWHAWGAQVGLLDGGAAPKRRWRSDGHPDLFRAPETPA